MNINDLINSSVHYHIAQQRPDGSFPAGHNGPYNDPETPVRNTAHFLFLLSSVFEYDPSPLIRQSAEKAIGYLFSKNARPYWKTFYCRDKNNKDRCNGLVGQAWVMEALIKASHVFQRSDCYELAEEVFFLHKWDGKVGAWQRMNVDGEVLTFDSTFNHQLWFAAVSAQLKSTPDALFQAKSFLRKVASNVMLYPDGVIFHASPLGHLSDYLGKGVKGFSSEILVRLLSVNRKKELYSKSVGYHGFNIYAFAMLRESFPSEKLWQQDVLMRITEVVKLPSFQAALLKSEYGYFYNLAGVEIAFAAEVLKGDGKLAEIWLDRQFELTYQDEHHPFVRNAADKNTAIARLYQAARFKNNYEVVSGGR